MYEGLHTFSCIVSTVIRNLDIWMESDYDRLCVVFFLKGGVIRTINWTESNITHTQICTQKLHSSINTDAIKSSLIIYHKKLIFRIDIWICKLYEFKIKQMFTEKLSSTKGTIRFKNIKHYNHLWTTFQLISGCSVPLGPLKLLL